MCFKYTQLTVHYIMRNHLGVDLPYSQTQTYLEDIICNVLIDQDYSYLGG